MEHSEVRYGQIVRLVGERVGAAYKGESFTVIKVMPKNIKVRGNTTGRQVNAHPSFLVLTDETDTGVPANATASGRLGGDGIPYIAAPLFVLGQVVRVTRPSRYSKPDDLWVVVKASGDRVNIARLGGDADRYLRTDGAALEVVEISDLLQRLAANV